MPRLQLIELHEEPWCPALVRDGLRSVLQQISSMLPAYEVVVDVLLEAMDACGTTEVLDLCAGAGGPWVRLAPRLAADPRIERIVLTDLYPDLRAMEAMQRGTAGLVRPHARPVDALEVPADMPGFRTVFAAFHHFDPDQARRVLADAAAAGRGVGIFELTERRPYAASFVALTSIPLALGLMPFVRPLRPGFLPLTYLLPAIPLVTAFDGLVSCLRSYTPEELLAMGEEVAPHYRWRAGRVRAPQSPLFVVYLTGVPG